MGKSKSSVSTLGNEQATGLTAALEAVARAPLPGARDLFVVPGLKPGGAFATTQENVLVQAGQYLAGTNRVFKFGDGIVFEFRSKNGIPRLVHLTEGTAVVSGAEHLLANLMVGVSPEEGQFPIPKGFADLLLRSEPLRDALPVIKTYAHRPVFDDGFILRGPGWHPGVGILVHGPCVDPIPWTMPAPGLRAVDRLPPRLKGLLGGFCFKSDADLVNTLGLLLTALLVGRYVRDGKPLALIDGNQPGVGKTLLTRIVGVIADGSDPPLLPYVADEEELRKTIGAHLRAGNGSVIGLDNAKVAAGGKVESPALESLASGAELALRILGKTELFRRTNDLIWALTMNDTRASDDLVRRGLPIRLEYEGDPGGRQFAGDPVKFASAHRVEILGELAGMIAHWTTLGRPPGAVPHRFKEWVAEVGGILCACGFPEFLSNLAEAAVEFSAEADELTALAEHVLKDGGPGLEHTPGRKKDKALTAGMDSHISECETSRGRAGREE
jgi:hypothetical protein